MRKRSYSISELRSYPTRFNLNPDLSERVVVDLLNKNEIFNYDLSMSSQELEKRYSRIEPVGIKYTNIDDIPLKNIPSNFPLPSPECEEEAAVYHLELDNIDYVVCLQGRSGFYREYQENADKFQLCPQNADSDDTIRRFMYSLMVAKQAALNNFRKGINDIPYVFFNGVAKANQELKKILKTQKSFDNYILSCGYSSDYFFPNHQVVIDEIPLDNTLGQFLGLSFYLEQNWGWRCIVTGEMRSPNLVVVTSSYHVERVKKGICANSPVFSSIFWKQDEDKIKGFSPTLRRHIAQNAKVILSASITVLGCDRQMTAVNAWEKDLFCDMQATLNYSSKHRKQSIKYAIPSIAATPAPNIVSEEKVEIQKCLAQERWLNTITARQLAKRNLLFSNTTPAEVEEQISPQLLLLNS